jgi:hypothetical protein
VGFSNELGYPVQTQFHDLRKRLPVPGLDFGAFGGFHLFHGDENSVIIFFKTILCRMWPSSEINQTQVNAFESQNQES